MDPTQANRPASFKTELADDAVVLRGFRGEEHLSRPFTIYAELGSKDPAIDMGALIGKPAGIRLNLGSKGTRFFHGYISKMTQLPGDDSGARYEVVMVPWLWLLTRTSDCRIFQEILKVIVEMNLKRVEKRVIQNHKVPFSYDADVPKLIAQRCTELDRGARLVDAIVTNQLLPEVGREFLHRLANGLPIRRVHILAKDGGFGFAFD